MHAAKIPAIIHLISFGISPSREYWANIERMKQLHPSWEIKIWDDAAATAVVKTSFPDWEQQYAGYKLTIQRADIFRIMAIYLYGGFYLDMDMKCLQPLDELRQYNMILGVEKTLTPEECMAFDHRYGVRIASYMFGSKAQHPFWPELLEAAKAKAGLPVEEETDVLESTGPGLLTDVYHENAFKYDDILLLANPGKACLGSCGPASCHFGDYAAHLHYGSWRWENEIAPALVQRQATMQDEQLVQYL